MRDLPTWPVAGASLLVAFGVAEVTGVRPVGGLVLLAAAWWCVRRWRVAHDRPTITKTLGVWLAAFVVSHLLGLLVGAWPAVLAAAAVTAFAVWRQADRAPTASVPATMRL